MSRPRRDTDLTLIPHRDRGSPSPAETIRGRVPPPDDDAPGGSHHEDYSGTVLAAGFRSVEPGSDAERALIAVVDLLARKADAGDGGGGKGGDRITRAFIGKLAGVLLAGVTLVQPTTDKIAELALSPSSALERKIDDMLTTQSAMQQQAMHDSATTIALAKWVVSCEIARDRGLPQPELPAAVKLILVQDELARSTGP